MTINLPALIQAAKPGDIIAIPPGDYPFLEIRSRSFSPPLTLVSLDQLNPARIDGLHAVGVSGLRLVGLDIHMLAPSHDFAPVVFFQSCTDVDLIGGKVHGSIDAATSMLFGKAISIADGLRVTVSGVEVFDFYKGVSFANVADTTVQVCDIHHGRTSPIDGGGDLQRLKLLYNRIRDTVPVPGDHSDGIHLFTKNSKRPCDGLVIMGNSLEDATTAGTLGINLQGSPAPGGFTNALIIANTERWNNNQGITSDYVQADYIGNLLLPAPGLDDHKHAPSITMRWTDKIRAYGNTCKMGPSLAALGTMNTGLTDAQITQYGAKV